VAHVRAWARGLVPSCARAVDNDRDGVTVVSIWSHRMGECGPGTSEVFADGIV
jgi:hypothetical protein